MHNNYSRWPYLQASNYSDWESILQVLPQLKSINPAEHVPDANINGIIIRSANDDNVHKAIKYGIWTTTPKNKNKIEQLWQRKLINGTTTYLFFSAVKSGMFEGVARLVSGYHEQTFPFWWENHTLKFKGYFEIEWVYIKDVNNKHFAGLYNYEGEQVVKSKDCDTLDSETANKMLEVFANKKSKRNIFMDFAYMDERQSQYIRKMYETTNYYQQQYNMGYDNRFNLSQLNLTGMSPLNQPMNGNVPVNGMGMNGSNMNGHNFVPMNGQVNMNGGMNQMMGIPSTMMKPNGNEIAGTNLGFQMNPVSKNSKKK